jgi:hypothetical protein
VSIFLALKALVNINSHKLILCLLACLLAYFSGNQLFRKLVESKKALYISTPRRGKPAIAKALINQWRCLNPPGRFLAKKAIPGSNTMLWYEIGDDAARKRTSKSLGEKKGSGLSATTCLERNQFSGPSSLSPVSESNLPSQEQKQDRDEALLENARALQLAFQTQARASFRHATDKESTHLNASKLCMNPPSERMFQDTIGSQVVRNQQQLFFSHNTTAGGHEAKAEANSGIGSRIPTAADLLRCCLGDGMLFDDVVVVDTNNEYAGFDANLMEPTHMASKCFAAAVMSRQTQI